MSSAQGAGNRWQQRKKVIEVKKGFEEDGKGGQVFNNPWDLEKGSTK